MGQAPDAVAGAIRAAGVRGLRDSTSLMNPVVRYLNRSLDIGGTPGDRARAARRALSGSSELAKVREVPLPVAVQVFLDCFHRGLYPDLEGA